MKGYEFEEQPNFAESGLVGVLYLAVVEPALKAIGVIGKGEPYFVWAALKHEVQLFQNALGVLAAIRKISTMISK